MSTPDPIPIQPSDRPAGRFSRPKEGRMIAGVAAAIARRLNIDVGLVRIAFVVSIFFGGLGILAYLAGWALLPEESQEQAPAERWFKED